MKKLIACHNCDDYINPIENRQRKCECGHTKAMVIDNIAYFSGQDSELIERESIYGGYKNIDINNYIFIDRDKTYVFDIPNQLEFDIMVENVSAYYNGCTYTKNPNIFNLFIISETQATNLNKEDFYESTDINKDDIIELKYEEELFCFVVRAFLN